MPRIREVSKLHFARLYSFFIENFRLVNIMCLGELPAVWNVWESCNVLVHAPVRGSQIRRLLSPSPPPVTICFPSGVKPPHVTGPLWPVNTFRAQRSFNRLCLPVHEKVAWVEMKQIMDFCFGKFGWDVRFRQQVGGNKKDNSWLWKRGEECVGCKSPINSVTIGI